MRIKTVAIAAALFGATMAAPVAAQAALSQCSANQMCVWGNNDFEWLIAAQAHGQGVIDVFNDSAGENNQADSWANKSGSYAGCLYDGQGTGPLLTMNKVSNDNDVFFDDSDKTSSMRTNGAC